MPLNKENKQTRIIKKKPCLETHIEDKTNLTFLGIK